MHDGTTLRIKHCTEIIIFQRIKTRKNFLINIDLVSFAQRFIRLNVMPSPPDSERLISIG